MIQDEQTTGFMPRGGARGQNIEHLCKLLLCCISFSDACILVVTIQKVFLFGVSSVIREEQTLGYMPGGGARSQKLGHLY